MKGLPSKSLIHGSLPRIDYADSFSAPVYGEMAQDVQLAAKELFGKTPRWVIFLVGLRNAIVKVFGLRTGFSEDADPETLFTIIEQTPNELLMGEDDKHLKFTLSVLLEDDKYSHWVIVTTAVMYHNWFGKFYFFFVKPFHRLIVRSYVRRLARLSKPPAREL
jgi:hypothetical protein